MTDHLLTLGHRRIAILTGRDDMFPARERLRGYRAAHEAHGVAIDPALMRTGSFLANSGFSAMSELLGGRMRPTAVIAGGIDMLSGVLKAIRAKGLVVPRDISVVGTGDSSLAELYDPPISVDRWDQGEVGRVAAGLLLDRISGRSAREPRHVMLPTEFVLRESTASPG
jgi:LacI family transcriptional regulator, galactose operon repressor